MPSIFGHVFASTGLTKLIFPEESPKGLVFLAGFCAFLPDLDVIGFYWGIPYSSDWGHRGFTHSIVFCVGMGFLVSLIAYRKSAHFAKITAVLIAAAVSHPLLDMMTNGGRGCAIAWPFHNARSFFPFRPIKVSPIGIEEFFSPWGFAAFYSEVVWIGFPMIGIFILTMLYRQRF